jgi:hypothetical protein
LEITDERAPPVRRRVRGRHAPRRCRGLKPLSGQRAARPDSSPRPRRRCPDSAAPARLPTAPRLTCAAAAPTGHVHMPLSEDAMPRCPSAPEPSPLPGRLRRHEHDHGERRPCSPLAVLHPWSIDLTLPSLLAIAGPPPATVAPSRRRDAAAEPDFFSSPSTRSSGELAFRPPCPAGSLTVVGARPPPFAPSPPLWRRRRPRHDACVGAVTAPTCAALRRAVVGRASRGRPSEHRPDTRGRGPCTRCVCGPSRRHGRGPRANVHLG